MVITCSDGLGPGENVVPDLQDLLHGLGHSLFKEWSGLEQGVLKDHLDFLSGKDMI